MNKPRIKPISTVDLVKPVEHTLSNGIPLYVINACPENVSRIDVVFAGGTWHQSRSLVALFTNQLLREGNTNMSSVEIAQQLDFYGSWLQLSNSYHHSYVTLYSLNKYLPQSLAVLEAMIKESIFPEEELKIILNTRKQQYIVNSQKVDVLASRYFQDAVYGSNHPYGKVSELADYDTLKVDFLKTFYSTYYHSNNCKIVFSGHIDDKAIQLVERFFGRKSWGSLQPLDSPTYEKCASTERYIYIEKQKAVQSAVVIGRPLFDYFHPDYHSFNILNTVLGGYFGSRLMSNIREKKGYTYGISSHVSALLHGGYFCISSQTGTDFTRLLMNEVWKEMEKLCEKNISQNELKIVRNYMLGSRVRGVDGVFAQAEAFLSLLTKGLDYSFYEHSVEAIKNSTPETVKQLAQRYFTKADFYEVVCGK